MKSTGIVRKLDELGRIVLPIELRTKLDINPKDYLEIFTSNDKIVLRKYESADIFTGEMHDYLVEYMGKKVSKQSVIELNKLFGLQVVDTASDDSIEDEFEEEFFDGL